MRLTQWQPVVIEVPGRMKIRVELETHPALLTESARFMAWLRAELGSKTVEYFAATDEQSKGCGCGGGS